MIDKQLLRNFVVGLGSDKEVDLCESYLQDCDAAGSDSVVEFQLDQDTQDDSLIQSLKCSGEFPESFDEVTADVNACIQEKLATTDVVKFLRPPENDDEIGRIGKYRLLKKIGSGGMGIVFRAQDIESELFVAVKVMNPMTASNPLAAERFQREVRSAAKLDHERIVKIYDVGTDAGIPFFAMELLEGRSLGQYLEQHGRLPASEVKQIIIQIAEGLDYASQHGILHRDIKPDNLWLRQDGSVVILDFGLARAKDDTAGLTNTGDVLGTPRYMAPEQVKGHKTDQRTDLFSLGSVMYEMLSGSSKFADENVYATMMAVTERETTPAELIELGCPRQMASLTCELLAKEPDKRPASAADVLQRLEQLNLSPPKPKPGTSGARTPHWPGILSIIAFAFLITALGIFIYVRTDRGTLVIEAGQGVEITTENNGVKIRLVDSDKTYTVSVGLQKLPSGSYEIVVDDESDDYSFSTQRFVIRRGEQNLVTVSLKADGTQTEVLFPQKYASVTRWLETNNEANDLNSTALGTVAETDGRDFVFRLDAGIDQSSNEFRIKKTRFFYSLDQLFGSQLRIMRAGKIIGHGRLLDALPLAEGERRDQTSYIGRINPDGKENVTLRNDDVVFLQRDRESMRRDLESMRRARSSIAGSPNGDSTTWQSNNIRQSLAAKFPGIQKFYIGSVKNVSSPLVRFQLHSYFDLTIESPRSGEEWLSNGNKQVPSLSDMPAYLYAGSKRIGHGRVTGLLEKDNFVTTESPLPEDPLSYLGKLVIIPMTDNEAFLLEPESNLADVAALPILETLGLKAGEPLTQLAMVTQPKSNASKQKHDFESWTIETKHHRAPINDMSINFNRDLAAIASDDATVRIWQLNGELAPNATTNGHIEQPLIYVLPCRFPVQRVCWSPTGNVLATATHDLLGEKGSVLVWRIVNKKAELIHRLEIQASELAFCPFGSRLAILSEGLVTVIDLLNSNPRELFSFGAAELTRSAWSPDGKMIACSRSDPGNANLKVSLFDVEKATIDGKNLSPLREYQDCHSPGFIQCSDGSSVLCLVHRRIPSSTISILDGSTFTQIATAPLKSNSQIKYRENHNHFFRIDTHFRVNFVQSHDIFLANIERNARQTELLQFEKLKTLDWLSGNSSKLRYHFVLDRKNSLIDGRQFTECGTSQWLSNLIPTEHDVSNGFTFQLHPLNDGSIDTGRIRIRNILNGETLDGPIIKNLRNQTMLIQKGAVASSPDGKNIAILGQNVVRIHDLKSNSTNEFEIDEFKGSPPRLSWTSDNKYVIAQNVSETSLTIIDRNSKEPVTRINAERNALGHEFSDTSDRVVLDRNQPHRVFWRHRSNGVGFFDIESGRKLFEYVAEPQPKDREPWLASYDWHQSSGRICLLIRDSMLKNESRLEIHKLDGDNLELLETVKLDTQLTSDAMPKYVTFDANADQIVMISKITSRDRNQNQGDRYRAATVDWKANTVANIGAFNSSNQEFLTNRSVVVTLTKSKAMVLSVADAKIHYVPFAVDSLQPSRSLSKFGDQWLLTCGRQTTLFDENFKLVSTILTKTPGYEEGISITGEGSATQFNQNKRRAAELLLIGVQDNQLTVEPYMLNQ